MNTHHMPAIRYLILSVLMIGLAGCQTAYYNTMEKLGVYKRDILVDRVEEARNSQDEAKEQFKSAFDRFASVLQFNGGNLEEKYTQLNAEFEASMERAEEVRDRIDSVEDVGEALFAEWEQELEQYSRADLRRASESRLRETRDHYQRLIRAMRKAERSMDPPLEAFQDQVLFLKHNLNARAIASLEAELASVRSNVRILISDMEKSIAEADAFIKGLEQ
jgi:Skp family chaperone for outer membrane proteins